ncbi:DMT family transporter [Rhodoligotrophos defluvii]|uniref:DMT family transporter n=1 Tax=Rhodoligotrophos defluvii TaxID=2561934 RepID=UPI0010C9FA60|nr:DMT family transporter [Rhodoligotrophos defluvii]
MTAPSSTTSESATKPVWLTLAPVIFLLLWSGGYPSMKIGIQYADPFMLLLLRYFLIVVVLGPVFLIMRPPLPSTGRQWLHLAITGLLLQVFYFSLCYWSVALGLSAGALALILALQPILVGLFAPWSTAERVTVLHWVGLVLGTIGAAVVIASRATVEATSVLGIASALGALLAITAATLYEKRFGSNHHPVTANLVQCIVAAVTMFPIAWFLGDMHVEWSLPLAGVLAYLVIANSLIAITLLLILVRRGEASKVSALFFLVPPVAAIQLWVLLGETMPLIAWFGMIIATIGVALVTNPRARAPKPAEPPKV